jgi:DNA-binding response OmpR family regulator
MPANQRRPNLQALERMLQVAMTDSSGSDYQRAVGNRLSHSFVLLRRRQHGGGAHRGASALKRNIVRIHDSQTLETEVAHGPSGGADVERIARVHQDDAQMIEFSRSRQAVSILRQPDADGSVTRTTLLETDSREANSLHACCRRVLELRRANVKNLSNLCDYGESGRKRCKLSVIEGLIAGNPGRLAPVQEDGFESSKDGIMGQIVTPMNAARLADPMNSVRPMGKILVVEDDPAVQKALKRLFESEGYTVEIQANGKSALESFQAAPPSVIILDLRLPKLSGSDLCKEVKAQAPALPIVVLSATSDVSDKVLLLELGADDYVTKPFSPRELLARVRAALRHTSRTAPVNLVSFDGISIDFKKMEILRDGKVVVLTAQEFKTLQFLVQNADRVIGRDELLNEVWGYQNYPSTRTVDNHILKLRQKLERDPASPVHFRTVHGMGYKFVR